MAGLRAPPLLPRAAEGILVEIRGVQFVRWLSYQFLGPFTFTIYRDMDTKSKYGLADLRTCLGSYIGRQFSQS